MRLKRVYFSETSKESSEEKKKGKDPDYITNRGIVGGAMMAGLGGTGLALAHQLKKKFGIKDMRSKKFRALSLGALGVGAGVSGYSAYKRNKDRKKRRENENKA